MRNSRFAQMVGFACAPALVACGLTQEPAQAPPSHAAPAPRLLDADAPAPEGSRSVVRTRPGLVGGGLGLLIPTYSLSVTVALFSDILPGFGSNENALLVPVAGPFVQMARTQGAAGNVVLALDGLGQLGGVALISMGYLFPQEVFFRDAARLTIAPLVGGGQRGLAVLGTF
jgi:hypothetical protein